VNQNAFSNVKVGDTTIAADTTTDTLTLVAGSNITLTPDATNDKITIAATNTTYSVVSTAADGLAPKRDGSTTKFLRGDGTWAIPPDTNTTYTFTNKAATLKWNEAVTVATVGGTDITVKLPVNPDTDTWIANTVGVAGYVAAPTKAANANMVWKTDSEGVPAWRVDSNDNTIYFAGPGISISTANVISNSGVRSISTGSNNGTISVNTNGTSADVAIKGLGSAAYTASTAYDAAGSADEVASWAQ
jgi:hypothetical protein